MSANHVPPAGNIPTAATEQALAERLERGEVLYYPTAPFALPAGDDLAFLLQQELGTLAHKNISYNPTTTAVAGHIRKGRDQTDRLERIFGAFSAAVTIWMTRTFPRYSQGWQLDRCSFRPQEEATRRLRLTARNDLLHVDAFPGRPSRGCRILRVFANINPHEPRVWVTSEPFARLLDRFGHATGLPVSGGGWLRQLGRGLWRLCHPKQARRSTYDAFMLRFHDFLKANEDFQDRGPKRLWTFPPGAVWLAMTDTCSHAVLRGRYALEHSYFLSPETLFLPAESPPALLAAATASAPPSHHPAKAA
jgi:hypothetical protein